MKDIRYAEKWRCGCRSKVKTKYEPLWDWARRRLREKQSYCPNCRSEEKAKNEK